MIHSRIVALVGLLACQPASNDLASLGAPAAEADPTYLYTTRLVRLRAEPSLAAKVVTSIPAADSLVAAYCEDNWCEVDYRGQAGFVQERYLADSRESIPSTRQARQPSGATSERPSARAFAAPAGPPDGATARCRDGSYSRSTSRSGTCSRHGGVAEWL